ncbi:hypothetical protein FQN60_012718 [Etheostoma spectabile]|uniref:Uncharacterized protein n=1 Tax=Etheostoma spectabile TaxID=54343 RepID=A0A5J5D8G7_9PERO|nr:hypothetical protein FQN60_012718 [Etheostoma spectabile]
MLFESQHQSNVEEQNWPNGDQQQGSREERTLFGSVESRLSPARDADLSLHRTPERHPRTFISTNGHHAAQFISRLKWMATLLHTGLLLQPALWDTATLVIISAMTSVSLCNSGVLSSQTAAIHPDCALVVQHMKAQEQYVGQVVSVSCANASQLFANNKDYPDKSSAEAVR